MIALKEAVRLDPGLPDPHYQLGLCLMRTGDRAGAIEAFRSATRVEPSFRAAYIAWGMALKEANRPAEAVVQFRRALELDPEDPPTAALLKEVEALSRSLTDRLEKQVAEMRVQLEELSNQHRVLQQKLSESQISSEGYINQIAELKKILAAKDTSYLAATHSQREAEAEREKLKVQFEDAQKQTENWKKKSLSNQPDEEKYMRVSCARSLAGTNKRSLILSYSP